MRAGYVDSQETYRPVDLNDLVRMDWFADAFPIEIDVVYARPDHPNNVFGALYRPDAMFWCHRRLAAVVLLAARKLHADLGWRLRLLDCLRPIEAQAVMASKGYPPELVAGPGVGGHPRAMAIDIAPVDADGRLVDMGTAFDHFTDDLSDNPAARDYTAFSGGPGRVAAVLENRRRVESAMCTAADRLGEGLLPLETEWWDYRFLPEVTDRLLPLAEADLPAAMQMTTRTASTGRAAAWTEAASRDSARQVLETLDKVN